MQIIEMFSSREAQVLASVVVPGCWNKFSQLRLGEGGRIWGGKGLDTARICMLAGFGKCLEDWDFGAVELYKQSVLKRKRRRKKHQVGQIKVSSR